MALDLSEKDLNNPEVLGEKLFTLTEIIISRHYYASSAQHFDDMRSIGVLKALEVISEGHFDSSKGKFASFLYFHIRNELHNFLYHENKRDCVDLEVLVNQGEEETYFQEERVSISYGIIHSVCMSFFPMFGENIENLVIKKLEDMDFEIKGRKASANPAFVFNYDIVKEEYGQEAEDEIVSRLVGLILWKRKEHEMVL